VDDPDQARSYFVLPITRQGRVAAILALGISIRHGAGQVALEKGGGGGFKTGGWSLLNGDGTIYMSWNPDLLGTRVLDPAALAGLAPGADRNLSTDDQVLLVSPMTSTIDPTYLAFAMPAADFYREQRLGQAQRAASYLALVAGAVLGLAMVNDRRERAVRRSEARLDALLQSAHDVVVVVDQADRATFVSSAVRRLLGYEPTGWSGRELREMLHPEDRARVKAMVADSQARGMAKVADVRLRDADGSYRWFDFAAVDLRDHREIKGVLLTCHEVNERRALQDQLALQARHDPLTGLPNRTVLSRVMAQLASGDEARPFAVLFVDLDWFKAVNDRLGHDAGDEVLRVVAQRFQAAVRHDGDNGSGDLVCRVGGDEFAVVLRDGTEAVARGMAERLIEAAGRPIVLGDHTVHIGATIGVSLSHTEDANPEIAMRLADQAMYEAKAAGRGTYALSDHADARD
jgi:diguanylate cyclase (GGDEF)-like protein/PAS domain S-box-containing protein